MFCNNAVNFDLRSKVHLQSTDEISRITEVIRLVEKLTVVRCEVGVYCPSDS